MFALDRLGINAVVSDDAHELLSADKVIFPGVGEASSAMKYLREKKLDDVIKSLTQPVLGICLGMQLMCEYSEEGNTDCLGIFKGRVKKFDGDPNNKVPQVGWNTIQNLKSPLFEGLKENDYMYFVHGYYAEKSENTIATTHYILEYSSALRKNNFYAAQFHPEKSSSAGEKLLENFFSH